VRKQALTSATASIIRLVRRLRATTWDWGIDIRGDIRLILLLALSGARRRIGYAFTGGEALLTDVVPDDGTLKHLAAHHQRIAECLGVWTETHEYRPRLHISDEEVTVAADIRPFIGFHFGASKVLRSMPAAEAAQLINQFSDTDDRLVLFEPDDAVVKNEEIKSHLDDAVRKRIETWRGDLRSFIVTLSRARRFYAMDSGPAHIAAALDITTVVFFGPSLPQHTRPIGSNVIVVERTGVDCRPCDHVTCTNAVRHACMLGLAVAHIGQLRSPLTEPGSRPSPRSIARTPR
jgi:ADP-heptose:LPS heptosyltransferase